MIPGVSLAGVSMLTGKDVEDAMAGEAEGGLLIGDREEMALMVDVDFGSCGCVLVEFGRWALIVARIC